MAYDSVNRIVSAMVNNSIGQAIVLIIGIFGTGALVLIVLKYGILALIDAIEELKQTNCEILSELRQMNALKFKVCLDEEKNEES